MRSSYINCLNADYKIRNRSPKNVKSRQSQQDLENTREAIYQQVEIMQEEKYKKHPSLNEAVPDTFIPLNRVTDLT